MANDQNEGSRSTTQDNRAGGDRSAQSGSEGRWFAAMDTEEQRRIAAKGGRAAHDSGNAHEFTSQEAREAGRKGGKASRDSNEGGRSSGSNESGRGNSDR